MKKGGLTYCDKCGKGVIMSFTCSKCGRVICDTCGGMTTTQPVQHSWGTSQMLGGGKAECPFCDKGEQPPKTVSSPTTLATERKWWEFWK